MADIFLDTNYFIDAVHRKPEKDILSNLVDNIIYISPLSIHIYCYTYNIKIPDNRLTSQIEKFQLVEFSESILEKSLSGPTSDFEDNVQLHSAASADSDVFLTSDKKLLSLKFFGKTRISPRLEQSLSD